MRSEKRTIRTLSHSFYDLKYHVVWTPKYRGKALGSQKIKDEVRRILEQICKWKKWEIIELHIEEDHIHLCILLTPRDSISYVMQVLKGKSSAWLKKKLKSKRPPTLRVGGLLLCQMLVSGMSSSPEDYSQATTPCVYRAHLLS
jgi:REP element-mobilizing transposase RayT